MGVTVPLFGGGNIFATPVVAGRTNAGLGATGVILAAVVKVNGPVGAIKGMVEVVTGAVEVVKGAGPSFTPALAFSAIHSSYF